MSDNTNPRSESNSSEQKATGPEYALPKTYDPAVEEPKWQKYWEENGIYRFDSGPDLRPTFSIDTPPPYPSGEFHVGNGLNWSYIDFVARYERMRGRNVHLPQGWDCHGLPTEVRAEQTFKIRKNDLPAEKFIEICRKLTEEYIAKMKEAVIRLGVSIDWKLEYKTMDPSYYKLTQLSFIRLHKSGHLYRGDHPVNWCPRCETAIAEAEVVYVQRQGTLNYMKFGDGQETIEIASTRPELLAACVAVAVHPEDERYKRLIGRSISVPVFGQKVPVLADEEVDSKFGTGAVMVCTFGDKMDVKWQKKYNLPLIKEITEDGRIAVDDPRFKGLKVEQARRRAVEELQREGKLVRTEPVQQNIGTCWRCGTPVEIIARTQWFMKTRDMTQQVLEYADKLKWIPYFAKKRLTDWAQSLDWDWVISRQRVFATPIPVWYCKKCNQTIFAEEGKLPVDPRKDPSPQAKCPNCRSSEFVGEKDVLDTWMDSSISSAVHAGWPTQQEEFAKLFPADLQPNGLDIVRTWDYYLLVRGLALFRQAPYKTLLINGMVRGTDGRMMHKSYGNYVETGDVIKKFGADALRQWAASGGAAGYDIPFRWNEVEHGKKFLTKLWNVARFILANSEHEIRRPETHEFSTMDRWLLASIQRLISDVTLAFDNFEFNAALDKIRDFAWHSLADDYLEAVKYRLQVDSKPAETRAARYCLHLALINICKLLAPFCPHVAEAVYQQIPGRPRLSIHDDEWPKPDHELLDEKVLQEGKLLVDVIALARRRKSEKGLSLRSPVQRLVISAQASHKDTLMRNQEPILRTIRVESIQFEPIIIGAAGASSQGSDLHIEIIP